MAFFFEDKDRRVIPNFRSLKKTIELGELDSIKVLPKVYDYDNIDPYILDFNKNNTLAHAGDLLSAAILNKETENPIVKSAAKFILDNQDHASITLKQFANKILHQHIEELPYNINKIDEFLENNSLPLIHKRIAYFKNEIRKADKNPFLYCELARLYSIIGQKDFSLKNIYIAYNLSNQNRYVIRSFARILAHFKEVEQAHEYLRKNPLTRVDPWILASEIAFSTLRGKTSNFLKRGNDILVSKKFNPFSTSELASSIGTVEMINGTRKKSKDLFAVALINPNDNSLAQVEWANNKENYFTLNVNQFRVKNNYEASAMFNYNAQGWNEAITDAEKWFIDMPFTKRPVMFGHNIASYFLNDHEIGIKFCRAGLVANPKDEMIINNLAYSYAMTDNFKSAFDELNKININNVKDIETKICLLATTGLAYYRAKDPDEGRMFYLSAIEEAKENGFKNYWNLAWLHFIQEEVLCDPNSELFNNVKDQLLKIQEDLDHPEIKIMKDRVLKLIDQKKK